MEFEILTPLEKLPTAIKFNSAAIKKELSEKLEYYKGIEVTEDSLKDAKADRASLNALRTAVEDKRKAVKKACLAPYESFEKEIKTIVAMIDDPIQMIDEQTKAFAQKEQDEKFAILRASYAAEIGTMRDLIPIEKALNPKWANKGIKVETLIEEMRSTIFKVGNDLKIIATIGGSMTSRLQAIYLRNFDMSAALAEKERLEEQEAALKAVAPPPALEPAPPEPVSAPVAPAPTETAGEQTKTIKVIFHDTTAAFRLEMRALTQKHGIKYGGIE